MSEISEKIKRQTLIKRTTFGDHVKLEGELIFWAGATLTPTTPAGITPEAELFERAKMYEDIKRQLAEFLGLAPEHKDTNA
jgi:hypothetical protein